MKQPWVNLRACNGSDLGLFFSVKDSDERKAKAICRTCPVTQPCLEHAIRYDEKGIWGGTNEKQRIRLRIKRYQELSDSVERGDVSPHSNICEPTHPIYASHVSLSCISFPANHNQPALWNLAAIRFPSQAGNIAS